MADKVEFSRLLIKRTNQSGTIPTIPGPGQGLTQFTPTDTFIGEFFLNQQDDNLWIRTQNGQIPILQSGSTFPGGSGNCITDLYITNLYGCSPITLHDDFEVITNKLYRNQSGGQYDNTLSFGTSLFQDVIRLRAEDTLTSNESDFRMRTNDFSGNATLQGSVIGTNATMGMTLTSDPTLNPFMTKQDLSNNWVSSYDVAGFQQTISSTDGNQSAKFFIDDMTTTPRIGVRFDDFVGVGTPFTEQTQDALTHDLIVENTTERMNVETSSKTFRVIHTTLPTTQNTKFAVEDTFIELETLSPTFPVYLNGKTQFRAQAQTPDATPTTLLTLNAGVDFSLGTSSITYKIVASDDLITNNLSFTEEVVVSWDGLNLSALVAPVAYGALLNNFPSANYSVVVNVGGTIDFIVVGEVARNINWKYYIEVVSAV